MFNIAYGLGCDSDDDPRFVRMDKFVTALNYTPIPAQFLLVGLLCP
jgi:hypothetical protein